MSVDDHRVACMMKGGDINWAVLDHASRAIFIVVNHCLLQESIPISLWKMFVNFELSCSCTHSSNGLILLLNDSLHADVPY